MRVGGKDKLRECEGSVHVHVHVQVHVYMYMV